MISTTMDDQTKTEYEAKCQGLRVELKTWESSWAKDNGGKKPGREDIKRNPDIGMFISVFMGHYNLKVLTLAKPKSTSIIKSVATSSMARHPRRRNISPNHPGSADQTTRHPHKHPRSDQGTPRHRPRHASMTSSWRRRRASRGSSSAPPPSRPWARPPSVTGMCSACSIC